MDLAILVLLTLLSCLLFEFSKLGETLSKLTASYKKQFRVMADKSISDEDKQKALMRLVSKQLVLIGRLILGILLFIAPFLSLFLLQYWNEAINPNLLITFWGVLIPILTVLVYIIVKKAYARIYFNG